MAKRRPLTRAEAEAAENLLDALNNFDCDVPLTSRRNSPLTRADREQLDTAVESLTTILMRIRDRYAPNIGEVSRARET